MVTIFMTKKGSFVLRIYIHTCIYLYISVEHSSWVPAASNLNPVLLSKDWIFCDVRTYLYLLSSLLCVVTERWEWIAAGHKETVAETRNVTRHSLPSLCWANEWMQASKRERVCHHHSHRWRPHHTDVDRSPSHMTSGEAVVVCPRRPRTNRLPDASFSTHRCRSMPQVIATDIAIVVSTIK